MLRHPLTSVWPLFLICTIHDHFYVLLVLNSLKIPPTILQRPASVCLCGNLGNYRGNIDSNSCLDLCDCCPIKNTHRQDMCSFRIAKNKLFSLDLTHAVRLNTYRSNLYGVFFVFWLNLGKIPIKFAAKIIKFTVVKSQSRWNLTYTVC